QKSHSFIRPLSRSVSWTEELMGRLRSNEDSIGGSGEYLVGYRRGCSQSLCPTRRPSSGQVSTCSFHDIFTGQF
ncbi:unnamed protein product, partial [Tetraodon nigroviridis]